MTDKQNRMADQNISDAKARAVFAAFAGAHLLARSRADILLFDAMIQSYRDAGLLPIG